MSSNINPTNIDGSYPIAGQDNDSQGFRDNFTNIKTNLQYAKTELEDLQNKVVLKSALTGTALNNDLNNALLYRPQLKSASLNFREFPGNQSLVTVSFLDAMVQRINTGGPLTINLADFPAAGVWGSVKIWLHVVFGINQTTAQVNWPASVTMGVALLDNFSNNQMTFTAAGDYLYELSTADAGSSFWITRLG